MRQSHTLVSRFWLGSDDISYWLKVELDDGQEWVNVTQLPSGRPASVRLADFVADIRSLADQLAALQRSSAERHRFEETR